jgi:hypothetical protein
VAETGSAGALAVFAAGWRARFPEWELAERFLPAAARERALAGCVLWQELADAAWGGEDPRPGLAKLAWWRQELLDWRLGAGRHPLAATFADAALDWQAVATALATWPDLRDRPRDAAECDALLMPAAQALAAIEGHAGRPGCGGRGGGDAGARHALARLRLLHAVARGAAAMPLAAGDAGDPACLDAWRGHLVRLPDEARPPDAAAALQHALLVHHVRSATRRASLAWAFTCWQAARTARD